MIKTATDKAFSGMRRVLLVAPMPPPYGGMALQARQLQARLAEDGIAAAFLPSNFALPPGFDFPVVRTALRAVWIWVKLARAVPTADVVHVLAASWLYFFIVVYPAVIVARFYGVRVIVNYRGGEAGRFFRWFGWAAALPLHLAHVVTAPSRYLAALIEKRFGIAVPTVPNILDTAAFRYRHRESIAPRLIVTRHLRKSYGVDTVLRAFAAVQERYPEASLRIAGTGDEEQNLRALTASLALNNVAFLGHVEHRQLPVLYDDSDIYINASLIDNFPGALLEASAAGLVMITTDAGGIPFIYTHEQTALVVPAGDWRGLARGVLRLLESPSEAARLARAAARAAQACSWEEVRNPLFRAYGFSAQASAAVASISPYTAHATGRKS